MLIRTGFKFQCSTFLLRKRKYIQSTKRTSFLRADKIKNWFEFVDVSDAIFPQKKKEKKNQLLCYFQLEKINIKNKIETMKLFEKTRLK